MARKKIPDPVADEVDDLPEPLKRVEDPLELAQDLVKDPEIIRAQTRFVYQDRALPALYQRLQLEDLPTSALVDIAKILIDAGDLKPKAAATQASGPAFSIQINLGDGKEPIVLEAHATPAEEGEPAVPIEDASHAEPEPNFNTPALDFDFQPKSGDE